MVFIKKLYKLLIGSIFISQLLEKDSTKRLGSGYGDFDDIKQHDFFKTISWDQLIQRKITPPFNPSVVCILKSNF